MEKMFACKDCGKIFEEWEIKTVGNSERCPWCLSDEIGDASLCEECEEWFDGDVLYGSTGKCWCRECLEKKATVEMAIKVGMDDECDPIKVSGFFSEFFSKDEIEKILMDKVKEICPEPFLKERAKKYCLVDEYWFADEFGDEVSA